MADFKSLHGIGVKDEKARSDIEELKTTTDDINEVQGQLYNPNLLINGGFQVWQRGESKRANLSQSPFYVADRWQVYSSTNTTYIECSKNSGFFDVVVEGDETCKVRQIFENPLPAGDYTVSFNVIALSGKVKMRYMDLNGNSPDVDIDEGINEITINVNSLKEISFYFYGASSLSLHWVKLEHGRKATQFVDKSYGEELALCKRFYQKSSAYDYFGPIISMGSNVYRCNTIYHGFRESPTVIVPSGTQLSIMNASDGTALFNIDVENCSLFENGNFKITTVAGTSLSSGVTAIAQMTQAIGFDSEIY